MPGFPSAPGKGGRREGGGSPRRHQQRRRCRCRRHRWCCWLRFGEMFPTYTGCQTEPGSQVGDAMRFVSCRRPSLLSSRLCPPPSSWRLFPLPSPSRHRSHPFVSQSEVGRTSDPAHARKPDEITPSPSRHQSTTNTKPTPCFVAVSDPRIPTTRFRRLGGDSPSPSPPQEKEGEGD